MKLKYLQKINIEKICQNERSFALCNLNVNKVSQIFHDFLYNYKTPSSVQNCHELNKKLNITYCDLVVIFPLVHQKT